MRRISLLSICLLFTCILYAQEKLFIHSLKNKTEGVPISLLDSITFNSTQTSAFFGIRGMNYEYPLVDIDSISLGNNSYSVEIEYNENQVKVNNPLAYEGITVKVVNSDVIVYSSTEIKDITYILNGTASDGMFKIYSQKRYSLKLNGLHLTNPDGPAMSLQSKNKATLILTEGSVNTLSDGSSYAYQIKNEQGEEEEQRAALFSEGKMIFEGSGSLVVNGNGNNQHAIASDDYIEILEGNITVSKSIKDGIHGKDGLMISGGTLKVTASGDGLDGDEGPVVISGGNIEVNCSSDSARGITCDSTLLVSAGTIKLNMKGKQSKGILGQGEMTLSGGEIIIISSGGVYLETVGLGYNPKYSCGIKCDTNIVASGANISIECSGTAAKGISSDYNIYISGGIIHIVNAGSGATYKNTSGTTDSYSATGITSDKNVIVNKGSLSVQCTGIAGKAIRTNGGLVIGDNTNSPVVNLSTSGSKLTISGSSSSGGPGGPGQSKGDYDEAKTIKSDGEVVINNGTITISSSDDAIKSDQSIIINNGSIDISKALEAIESPEITVNNGNIKVSASNDGFNATKGSGGESSDGSILNLFGGEIMIDVSNGDGLDSNGNIVMTGGTVVVHGPQSQPEVGIDFNGTFNISGGVLAVSGTNSNMTEGPNSSSTQYYVVAKSTAGVNASTLFHVQDSEGNGIITFKPVRKYYSMIFSSPILKNGSAYSIYTGGTSSGVEKNGFYSGGSYSGGTQKKTFTISAKGTNITF